MFFDLNVSVAFWKRRLWVHIPYWSKFSLMYIVVILKCMPPKRTSRIECVGGSGYV